MHRSLAVFFCALSCASAFPVVFLTHEEGSSAASPRLFDCVSTHSQNAVNHAAKHLSYKCRPNARSYDHQKVNQGFPTFEILNEPLRETTVVEEISVPSRSLVETLFPSSHVISNTRYEVVEEKPKRNRGGCDDDEVFVAELDLCMPFSPQHAAPQTATIEEEETIVIAPDFTILEVGYKKKPNNNGPKCPEGEIYVSDIGMCVKADNCWPAKDCETWDKEQQEQQEKKASSQVANQKTASVLNGDDDDDDDDDDKVPSFTILEVGFSKRKTCAEGEIYNPSIDECLPADNCFGEKGCENGTTKKPKQREDDD